ncbi:hypothetical protein OFL98_30585, partial [Escherichia coli]|nr:hypothetical protein [Escherichia coli]
MPSIQHAAGDQGRVREVWYCHRGVRAASERDAHEASRLDSGGREVRGHARAAAGQVVGAASARDAADKHQD